MLSPINQLHLFVIPGWAYDLKTVSTQMILNRVTRTGDGTHPSVSASSKQLEESDNDHHHPENPVFGWTDADLSEEDKMLVEITHKIDEKDD